jgi:predicted metal-dependent hydrolase
MTQKNLELPFEEIVMIGSNYATVIRSPRRRTVELQVREGEAFVRAPARISPQKLRDELCKSGKWLEDKLAIARTQPRPVRRRFVSGEAIPFLGRELILEIRQAPRGGVSLSDDLLIVRMSGRVRYSEKYIHRTLVDWISTRAQEHLGDRADYFASLMGVEWKGVKIKSFKTLWGSCSQTGELAFNWRIMMAPAGVADYVVVHELAHRLEFNHSQKFWKHVGSVMPEYKERREWLHHNAALLNLRGAQD